MAPPQVIILVIYKKSMPRQSRLINEVRNPKFRTLCKHMQADQIDCFRSKVKKSVCLAWMCLRNVLNFGFPPSLVYPCSSQHMHSSCLNFKLTVMPFLNCKTWVTISVCIAFWRPAGEWKKHGILAWQRVQIVPSLYLHLHLGANAAVRSPFPSHIRICQSDSIRGKRRSLRH